MADVTLEFKWKREFISYDCKPIAYSELKTRRAQEGLDFPFSDELDTTLSILERKGREPGNSSLFCFIGLIFSELGDPDPANNMFDRRATGQIQDVHITLTVEGCKIIDEEIYSLEQLDVNGQVSYGSLVDRGFVGFLHTSALAWKCAHSLVIFLEDMNKKLI